MLFCNGDAAIVELNDDMISFKPGTMKNLLATASEKLTVTKRWYHQFTWSVDDTGSENYH